MLYIVLFFWTLVIGGFSFISLLNANSIPGSLLGMAVGLGPLALTIYLGNKEKKKFALIHSNMLEAAGVVAGQGLDYSQKGTGMAVNKVAKTLTLLIDGKWKTYPFNDIRSWEAKMVTYAGSPSLRGDDMSAAGTGFYVTVKDVAQPVWRIVMTDQKTQDQWSEIFRQEIEEN